MLDFLRQIVETFVCWVQTGVVLALNATISGLGALWSAIVDQLPDMPDYPELPSWADDSIVLLNQIVDVAWLIAYMATFLTLFLILIGFMALFRWLKATD